MEIHELINLGNEYRLQNQPYKSLECYAQAFVQDPDSAPAWNNYGNVMRECGQPGRAVPFLQHAIILAPDNIVGHFNLAVALLGSGDYQNGWTAYESRWQYEHLDGTLPKYTQPRWTGEDISGKTLLIQGEQGHGDNIQFIRFALDLKSRGAKLKLKTTQGLIPLFNNPSVFEGVYNYDEDPGEFDYWVPIMSIPGILGVTLKNLPRHVSYLAVSLDAQQQWLQKLGPKTKMRIGFSWSGRRDTWLNQHKGMPFETMLDLIKQHPEYEWISLQSDATKQENQQLCDTGVRLFPGTIQNFLDTAALIMAMDVVLSVDTAVAHLSAALGRPTWIMLNWFATCWRWLTVREDSPWYSTARLFRQPTMGDWPSVIKKVEQYLGWFKV